ncbi:vacuolar proton-inorganic pyrophosphatase [Hordeum vulgare]|nr:vacuolar proton-inorganic pyrophosphatase [Hordeum vulgare]
MVVVPVAAAVGIAFAVLQWVLVSKVKVTTEPRVEGGEASASGCKYGASEYLIEEEEGLNDHNVVPKCAEIQTAISEADMSQILQLDFMYLSYFDVHLNCFEV